MRMSVRVSVGMFILSWRFGGFSQGEFAGMHAFESSQRCRQVPQCSTRTPQDEHFQAAIVIQVHVHRSDNLAGLIVLQCQ